VSANIQEYINSLPIEIRNDYEALKNALKEQYTNQDDSRDALSTQIFCLCQRPDETLREYINRTAAMVSKCHGREELYRNLARAFHMGILNNTDRGALATAEGVWKLKGRELLLRCLDFMRKWDASTTDFASARAGEQERIRRGIEEGRGKDKEMAELSEKVRREVELEIRGARQETTDWHPYVYGNHLLQVSAVPQQQYPNYPDYLPPGDHQQFRLANRPNYSQDYRSSSMELQQNVYDQVRGPQGSQ
jgi:hypothetical protein